MWLPPVAKAEIALGAAARIILRSGGPLDLMRSPKIASHGCEVPDLLRFE